MDRTHAADVTRGTHMDVRLCADLPGTVNNSTRAVQHEQWLCGWKSEMDYGFEDSSRRGVEFGLVVNNASARGQSRCMSAIPIHDHLATSPPPNVKHGFLRHRSIPSDCPIAAGLSS
jgi:hypothetical protein